MTDDLRIRLRDNDPALGIGPLAPEEVDRVLGLARSRPAPVRRMPGWLAPVAAAAVVALLTGGWVISHPSAVPAVPVPAGPPASVSAPARADAATLVLTLPGFPSQGCQPVTPALLRQARLAFRGTVASAAAASVTLTVTEWFAGTGPAAVVIRRDALAAGSASLDLTVGRTYLISSDGRTVAGCGLSGPDERALASQFGMAFRPAPPVTLAMVGPDQTSCVAVTAAHLRDAKLAFDGVVTRVSDTRVTISPTLWYAGTPTDVVVLDATPAPNSPLPAPKLDVGGRVLISSFDRTSVSPCGFSSSYTPGLAALYGEAFPG
jgi:hypothetical protein